MRREKMIELLETTAANYTEDRNNDYRELKKHGYYDYTYRHKSQVDRCISAMQVLVRELKALEAMENE